MKIFTVAAAVIQDISGRTLLSRRPEGKHMGGLWEFPGGKLEEGETPERALHRELKEELGVSIEILREIQRTFHREDDLEIQLIFFESRIIQGTPKGLEGQQIRWIPLAELRDYPTPPADQSLIQSLTNQ